MRMSLSGRSYPTISMGMNAHEMCLLVHRSLNACPKLKVFIYCVFVERWVCLVSIPGAHFCDAMITGVSVNLPSETHYLEFSSFTTG